MATNPQNLTVDEMSALAEKQMRDRTIAQAMSNPNTLVMGGSTPAGQFQAMTQQNLAQNEGQAWLREQAAREQANRQAAQNQALSERQRINQEFAGQAGFQAYNVPTQQSGTIGSLYGSTDSALSAYQNRLNELSKPVDEEKIRQDAINRVQSEIDAMNRYYAEKTRQEQGEARAVGESRLGQNAAINARRGMIGSDFGAARTSTIEQANAKIQNDIWELNNARRLAEQAAIMGKASTAADALIEKKQAQLNESLQAAVQLQEAQRQRAEKAADTRIAGLIAQGIEPSEADYDALAAQFGIDKETLKAKYAMSLPGAEKPIEVGGVLYQKQADGSYKALTPGKAATEKALMEVSPGASLYDPVTGKFIGTAPNRPESARPDVTNFADGTTRQYNPTTGSWDILATKPVETPVGGKPPVVTTINGQNMVYDEQQGVFKPAPVQATAVTPANTQQLDQINELANALLLDKEGLGDAVGPLSSKLPTLEGSTADFEARHAQLKSLLTRDALSAFKGFGPLSDRDLKIAEDSASALSLSMSERGYRQELSKILTNVANLKKQAEIKSLEQQKGVTLTNEQKDKMYQAVKDPKYKDLTVEEIWGAMGFKQESQPSSNGTTVKTTGMRTDRHNNPTAFTTDIARIAGLREGVDYVQGDPFSGGQFHTARLLGDPVATTIKVIDNIGFYTQGGKQRWVHTAMPKNEWDSLSYEQKKQVVKKMYGHEGGKELKNIFT